MKKLLLLFMCLPVFVMAQDNVVNSQRVFPKIDKVAQFEKALAAHVQKFHTGKWKWRVFTIASGPDVGGYHITEGPMNWDDIQNRGDLGAAHMTDWNTNIAPLLTKQTNSYATYMAELSTVALTDYSNWININHLEIRPGFRGDLRDLLVKMKKGWEADGSTNAVYNSSSSGVPAYTIVTRYKNGLKERSANYRPPFDQTYEKVNGAGSWNAWVAAYKAAVERSWSELLEFQPSLSSK
jgi:hypothetical protein